MKKQILIVDQSPHLKRLLDYYFEHTISVVTVFDGDNAIEIMDDGVEPDVVAIDLTIPDNEGMKLLQRLKNHPNYKNIPVLILVAKSQTVERSKALDYGADAWMYKPYNPKMFVEQLLTLAEKSETATCSSDE